MKRAALCFALACGGCASHAVTEPPSNTAHWNITLVTRPALPRQLDPAQFQIQITDGGKPVSGASVAVQLAMPAMDMGRNQSAAQPGAAGVYTATGRFTMPGNWQVAVQADKGRLHQSQSFPIAVR